MIKIVFCLRRLPGLTLDEFHAYWRDSHAPLVIERAAVLGIRRYVQNHSFTDPVLQRAADARGSLIAPYDGVAELWYDSIEAMIAGAGRPEARQAGRELLEDERRFIDLPNSPLFYVREHTVIPGTA